MRTRFVAVVLGAGLVVLPAAAQTPSEARPGSAPQAGSGAAGSGLIEPQPGQAFWTDWPGRDGRVVASVGARGGEFEHFEGILALGLPADELLGTRVVADADGRRIGHVEDVLVNEFDAATHAVVDIAPLVDGSERFVALPLAQFDFTGSGAGRVTVGLEPDVFRELPTYTRVEDGWTLQSRP